MIPYAGFLGKVMEFLVTKLLGKKLELTLDDKKKAGSFFMKLYFSLAQLEEVLAEIANACKIVIEARGTTLPRDWLEEISEKVDRASKQFLEIIREIDSILEIYDPVLSEAMSNFTRSKVFFLMANSFALEKDEQHGMHSITYLLPDDRLMTLDFDGYYNWVEQNWNRKRFDEMDWPPHMTIDFYDQVTEEHFKRNDQKKITEVFEVLNAHLATLTSARDHLRVFIASHFSIEDLLHARKPSF